MAGDDAMHIEYTYTMSDGGETSENSVHDTQQFLPASHAGEGCRDGVTP